MKPKETISRFKDEDKDAQRVAYDEFKARILAPWPAWIDECEIDIVADLREVDLRFTYMYWWGMFHDDELWAAYKKKDHFVDVWFEHAIMYSHKDEAICLARRRPEGAMFALQQLHTAMFRPLEDTLRRGVALGHLVQEGFIDVALPAPNLTPEGIALRSVLLKTHPVLRDAIARTRLRVR
jgi:hypothetical protein